MPLIRINGRPVFTIDVLSERFLFAHRIALGQLVEAADEVAILEGVMRELYGVRIYPKHYADVYAHVEEVLTGLAEWVKREKQLEYTPTPEEQRAGIAEIGAKLKEFGTVDAIAKRMGISHDEVLRLPYATVFMMLLADLEHSKFERRLHKVYESKHK